MLTYNIPAAALSAFKDKTITVRSDDTRALIEAFSSVPRENLRSLQVLSMDCDVDALLRLSDSVPIDLVVDQPTQEFSRLYRFAELAGEHPVRAIVRAVPGMTKAVKIAQALDFAVKLEINQPEAPVADEILSLAKYYLRRSAARSPVEPLHSLLFSSYDGKPTSVWTLQEEDPAIDRYVLDDGRVILSKRLVSWEIAENQFVGVLNQFISACREADECAACQFFGRCHGYFRVPEKNYRCDHVKRLFGLLHEAGTELRQDEEQFVELYGRDNSPLDATRSLHSLTANQSDGLPTADCSSIRKKAAAEQPVPSSSSMWRLNYRPEEFTRLSWATAEAEVVWEPRIRRINACVEQLEWASILEGVRACALRFVHPNELQALSAKVEAHGLTVVTLEETAVVNGYVSARRTPRAGEPFDYWCAIGRPSDVQLIQAAHFSHDEATIGHLLGYPTCCTEFFNRVWIEEGFIDTTWPMARNTAGKRSITSTHVEIAEASRCNVLLRWIGPRIVFHLPCSFDCQSTIKLADRFTEIARSAGFHQEMDWLEEMLRWPVEWASLHGLAEIRTPVGTISTSTDATAERYRVSYNRAGFSEKTDGHIFNCRAKEETPETTDLLPNDSLINCEWYHADNGFRSREDMDLCHKPIVRLAVETLAQTTGNVLDLACGNGVLLRKICHSNPNLIPWGVDASSDAITHTRLLSPHFAKNFVLSDIADDCAVWSNDREFQLVILSLRLLNEVSAERTGKLLRCIKERAKSLLVYAYDVNDHGLLDELARRTGVTLSDKRSDENVAMAHLEKL
jgi:hypothetical protein